MAYPGEITEQQRFLRRPQFEVASSETAPRETGVLQGCLFELLDATPGIVMVSKTDGRLLYMNSSGRKMLGVGCNDAIDAHPLQSYYTPDAYTNFCRVALPTCLETGQWVGDTVIRDLSGQEIPVSQLLVAQNVCDDDGDCTVLSSIAWDIREHKRTEANLRHMATHDHLTGLPNRALMLDRLTKCIQSAERSGHRVAVIFLDLDNFKRINDEIGHETANAVLCELSRRLNSGVRRADTVARYGGDEFVLLIPGLESPDASARALRQIDKALSGEIRVGETRIHVAASVGTAVFPDDGRDVESLLEKADERMYRRKRNSHITAISGVHYGTCSKEVIN